jgi:hypothetical protein
LDLLHVKEEEKKEKKTAHTITTVSIQPGRRRKKRTMFKEKE